MFIKKIFGVMLAAMLLILPQTVSAEKVDWFDRGFNFRNIRTVIVFDPTVAYGMNYGGSVDMRNMQDTYAQNARKLKCNVITEAQARQELGYQLGMNLNAMSYEQARQLIMQNAYRIADAWVTTNIDNLDHTYYVEPARTVWEQRRQTRVYRDSWGNRQEEVYYVQVPVTYPPRRVDRTSLQVTLEMREARNGSVIFTRKDVRDRDDYYAEKGMFGRITNSFFEDAGKKIR